MGHEEIDCPASRQTENRLSLDNSNTAHSLIQREQVVMINYGGEHFFAILFWIEISADVDRKSLATPNNAEDLPMLGQLFL